MSRDILDFGGNDIQKPTVFKLVKKNHRPALQGRYYPSQKRIPSEEVIYDPDTNTNRVIRFAPGEQSIYKDEQTSSPGEKVVVGDIIFQNGSLVVDHTNPLLLKYLSLSNFNQSNPNRVKGSKILFKEINAEKEAAASLDTEIAQAQAVAYVGNMEFDDLMGYARVLNVNINRSVKEVRHDMVILAKKDPERFMAGADDPVNKRKQTIHSALQLNIIEINGRSINWVIGEQKNLIVPVPIGQDAVSWFAEWTMNDKDGEKVYVEIEKQIAKRS